MVGWWFVFFFFEGEDGIRDDLVTGVQTCALPISFVANHKGERGKGLKIAHALLSFIEDILFQLVTERWFWYDCSATSVPYISELQQVFLAPISTQNYLSYAHCSSSRFSVIIKPVTDSDGLLQTGGLNWI